MLVMAIKFPQPSPFQYATFRTVLALAAAGVAAFVPGFFRLKVGRTLRAGGALAVFVLVYRFSPAPLVLETPLDPEDVSLLENYKLQCDAGDAVACNSAGVMIGDREGAERDYELSATFYERACDLDYGKGCRNAARRYRRGKGRPKDMETAVSLYEKSCDLRYSKGCSDLARLYESNQTGAVNLELARQYYSRACDLGDSASCSQAGALADDT
jgi:hypothetical protein